jgi:hypothetical protein
MRIPGTRHLDNERGATLVFVAVALVALLSMVALAVDYGMLASARADAQRAADASALAGASTYMDALSDAATAEERALDWAQRNHLLGNAVRAAEVTVDVDDPESTVSVLVERRFPLFFARIFGVETAPISAFASARVSTSGTAACIKPFGVPHGGFDENAVGDTVLLWESSGGGNNSEGYEAFALVGHEGSNSGVGKDIYEMLVDTDCAADVVTVGGQLPAKPGNNSLGVVKQGIKELEALPDLTWSPDGPYNGFNRPDYQDDPRVALVPTYDPATYTGTWGGHVTVTGFVMLFIIAELTECHPNKNPCTFTPNGSRQQLHAIVLPASGVSDTCSGENCADLNRVLQLVR